jgi:hypothetical protein
MRTVAAGRELFRTYTCLGCGHRAEQTERGAPGGAPGEAA